MKARKLAFVSILPLALAACPAKSGPPDIPPGNPPMPETSSAPTSAPEPDADPGFNPKAPPPVSFSPREKASDGSCYVEIITNPPWKQPVSCDAPIQPRQEDGWCRVALKDKPDETTPVACEESK